MATLEIYTPQRRTSCDIWFASLRLYFSPYCIAWSVREMGHRGRINNMILITSVCLSFQIKLLLQTHFSAFYQQSTLCPATYNLMHYMSHNVTTVIVKRYIYTSRWKSFGKYTGKGGYTIIFCCRVLKIHMVFALRLATRSGLFFHYR